MKPSQLVKHGNAKPLKAGRVVKVALQQRRLAQIKKIALRGSQSSQERSEEGRSSFGFVPADAQVRVVGWPKL